MSAGGQYLRRLLDTRAGRDAGVPDAARVPDRPPGRVAVIVAAVGGGGMRTPLMISGLIERRARLAVERVVLYDTDPDALHLVKTLADALLVRSGRPFTVQTTTSAAGAFDGASFVVTSIRVGGLAGRIIDEQVPLTRGVEYLGLNRLGWVRAVWTEGTDRLPEMLRSDDAIRTIYSRPLFAPDEIRRLGLLPNEYLQYYYHHDEVVGRLRAAPRTRAEE